VLYDRWPRSFQPHQIGCANPSTEGMVILNQFLFLSASLLALSVVILRLRGNGRWLAWLVPVSIFTFTLLTGLHLGLSAITGEGLNNAVFYHAATGLDGADVSQYIPHILAVVIAIAVVGLVLWRLRSMLSGNSKQRRWEWDLAVAALAVGAISAHPVTTASVTYFLRFSLAQQHVDGFTEMSKDIARPQEPRNLVIIYLESLERTYMDPVRFPNLTPRLAALETRSLSFSGLGQTVGADFTVGGMVATQCGTPLILSGGVNSGKMSQFLSGAICLGDLMSAAGYHLTYLGGASVNFAGKGAFYQTHGYDEVLGIDELRSQLAEPEYRAEWGLQDDTLFELGRSYYASLAGRDKPFVLTLLTLDTHHPNGHASTNRACAELAYGDGSNPMLNAVLCTDLLVGQFIDEILSGPHGSETVIAVMSDHLAMVNSATDLLNAGPRRNLLMVLDGTRNEGLSIDRAATTLDIGPTLLSYLGFDVPALGFGVDLMREAETLPERLIASVDDRMMLDSHLMGYQAVYQRLWAYPDISAGAYVNLERKEIQFGSNAFGLPAMFAIDQDDSISTLIVGDRYANESLTEATNALPHGTRYLWFDDCAALEMGTQTSVETVDGALCLMGGVRQADFTLRPIQRSGYLSRSDLAALWTAAAPQATEPAALRAIGIARGDLPTTLGLPSLATGNQGVLLQLSDFDNGASFVRRQTVETLTSGEDWLLQRGISLVGLTPEGTAEILDRLDQCDPAFDAASHGLWKDRIAAPGRFVAHLVLVHDSAFCGDSFEMTADPLNGLNLPVLQRLPARKAYAALIDPSGKAIEVTNPAFARIRLYLRPDGPKPDHAAIALSETPVSGSEEPALSAPLLAPIEPNAAESAAVVDLVQTAGCLAPSMRSMTKAISPLPVGARIGEGALVEHVGFAEGWWDAEPFGRWLGSKTASLSLVLPETTASLSMKLNLSTHMGAAYAVRVLYLGKTLSEFTIAGEQTATVDLHGVPHGSPVDLVLELIGPALTCPAMAGSGTDTRQLAMMLKEVTLTPSRPPSEAQEAVAAWPVHDGPLPAPAAGCILPGRSTPSIPELSTLPLGEMVTVPSALLANMLAFGPGWWADEEFGRWMAGGPASVALTLPEGPTGIEMSLTVAAFGGQETFAVVTHGNRELARALVGDQMPLVANLSLLPRGKPVILTIALDEPAGLCPVALDQSADDRALGLMLQSLILTETDGPSLSAFVAHAGGRLGATAGTNSIDALTFNAARFDLFEIDLNWTTDGELVCLHDWEEGFSDRFGDHERPVDLATFRNLLAQTPDRPQNCDLESLAAWLRANPDSRIVTDIKSESVKGLTLIAQRYPDLLPRFVPQAYQPDEIAQIRALGYRQVIWTLYKFGSNLDAVLREAKTHQPSAIAMPVEMARSGLLSSLERGLDVPLYVHTVNDSAGAACLMSMGAMGLYSADLTVSDLDSAPEPTVCESILSSM